MARVLRFWIAASIMLLALSACGGQSGGVCIDSVEYEHGSHCVEYEPKDDSNDGYQSDTTGLDSGYPYDNYQPQRSSGSGSFGHYLYPSDFATKAEAQRSTTATPAM